MPTERSAPGTFGGASPRHRRIVGAEPLEPRWAMAGMFTFTDVDGDVVVVKTSLGTDGLLAAAVALQPAPLGSQLAGLTLTNAAFAGTNVSIGVIKKVGDGRVDVGRIDATGRDLGKLVVAGDLASIRAGDANPATAGIGSMQVASLGQRGLSTGSPDLESSVAGELKSLQVDGNVAGATLHAASIATATVGGSILGSAANLGGAIDCSGKVGTIVVQGSVVGGTGPSSGVVRAAAIGSVTVKGSVIGGPAADSGAIRASGKIGAVTIAEDVVGGGGASSGVVAATDIAGVTVHGSVRGGGGDSAGGIHAGGVLGPVKILEDLVGGSGPFTGFVDGDTSIEGLRVRNIRGGQGLSSGHVGSQQKSGKSPILVTGNIVGGAGASSGIVEIDSAIPQVTVNGSILGGGGDNSGVITGLALFGLDVGGDVRGGAGNGSGTVGMLGAIAKASIGGALEGGTGDGSGTLVSLGASLGTVVVRGGIAGGKGLGGGSLEAFTTISSVTVQRSIVGGDGDSSGTIRAQGAIGDVAIAADLAGGAGQGSGAVVSADRVKTVTIGGSIRGGSADSSGAIRAGLSLGSLSVKGAVVGSAAHPVLVTAIGSESVVALPSIAIAGRVQGALFLSGFTNDILPAPVASVARIGTVTIGGRFSGSSIVAGARNGSFPNFGTLADQPNSISASSSIGSVTLGDVSDTSAANDHFGIVAKTIGSVTVAKKKIALPAAGGLLPLAGSTDTTIRRLP